MWSCLDGEERSAQFRHDGCEVVIGRQWEGGSISRTEEAVVWGRGGGWDDRLSIGTAGARGVGVVRKGRAQGLSSGSTLR